MATYQMLTFWFTSIHLFMSSAPLHRYREASEILLLLFIFLQINCAIGMLLKTTEWLPSPALVHRLLSICSGGWKEPRDGWSIKALLLFLTIAGRLFYSQSVVCQTGIWKLVHKRWGIVLFIILNWEHIAQSPDSHKFELGERVDALFEQPRSHYITFIMHNKPLLYHIFCQWL